VGIPEVIDEAMALDEADARLRTELDRSSASLNANREAMSRA
jgi:hypothetical protein